MSAVEVEARARTYGGRTLDERRAERRGRLIDAGVEQFGTRGFDSTTIKSVCDDAGLSERYFYESFRDRLELLGAVYERVVSEVALAAIAAADAAPPDLAARVRAGVSAFLRCLTDDPRRARVQLVEVAGRSEELERRRIEVLAQFAAYIERSATELIPGLSAEPSPKRHAITMALVGGTSYAALLWVRGELDMQRDALADSLTELYVAAAAIADA